MDEGGLCPVLVFERLHDLFVNRALCDDVVDDHRIGPLPLTPQPGVRLLVEL